MSKALENIKEDTVTVAEMSKIREHSQQICVNNFESLIKTN